MLISRDLPGSAGFSTTYYNQGSLTNKGVEFSLNACIIDHKDWKWNVSGNIGVNKGKIGDLGMLPGQFGALGERVGYFGNSLGDHIVNLYDTVSHITVELSRSFTCQEHMAYTEVVTQRITKVVL